MYMAAYKWYNVHKVDYVWGGWGELKFLMPRIVCVPLEKFVNNYT